MCTVEISDYQLERDINMMLARMIRAGNHDARSKRFEDLRNLVAMRSDRQIEKMERIKGLQLTKANKSLQ